MKYCKKCRRFYDDENSVCTECKKPLIELAEKNTPVYLLSSGGFELQRIKTALEDNAIPCSTAAKKHGCSADIVTGCDYAEYDLLVPYAAYNKAYELCVGIGAIKDEQADLAASANSDDDYEEPEEMTPERRTAVKIFSALLFILVAAAVIFATDFVAEIIKNLFN